MSALQQLSVTNSSIQQIAAFFWQWFRLHQRDVILKKRILFFSVTILVKDLKGLFEDLFGPEVIV